MNKKYMDFVPMGAVKPDKTMVDPVVAKSRARQNFARTTDSAEEMLSKREVSEIEINEMFAARVERPRAGVSTGGRVAKKGNNSENQPKFVKTEVEKRPLSKTPFVNTAKVSKRPLSKNVYQKKVEVPKEKASGPVTIINKPEKESRVGLIVTIVITIILGAAAGAVAFLLLPK